jgi:hypothetical protein
MLKGDVDSIAPSASYAALSWRSMPPEKPKAVDVWGRDLRFAR